MDDIYPSIYPSFPLSPIIKISIEKILSRKKERIERVELKAESCMLNEIPRWSNHSYLKQRKAKQSNPRKPSYLYTFSPPSPPSAANDQFFHRHSEVKRDVSYHTHLLTLPCRLHHADIHEGSLLAFLRLLYLQIRFLSFLWNVFPSLPLARSLDSLARLARLLQSAKSETVASAGLDELNQPEKNSAPSFPSPFHASLPLPPGLPIPFPPNKSTPPPPITPSHQAAACGILALAS